MGRTIKLFASLAIVLLALSACGGGSTGINIAVIHVQLTKATAPTTAYAADQMTVTLQKPDLSTVTATTDANGIASFTGLTVAGTYTVTKISGVDATGHIKDFVGREFVKDAPITTAAPQIDYVPGTLPTVVLSTSGAVTLNTPVPDIRKVTVKQTASVNQSRSIATAISTAEAAPFAGRIILTNINFDDTYADGLVIYNKDSGTHFTLQVADAATQISAMFYTPTAPAPSSIGTLVTSAPYPAIQLEVPSATDWALTGTTSVTQNTTPAYNSNYTFGLLEGGTNAVLWYTNFGGSTTGGPIIFSYEIQSFTTI